MNQDHEITVVEDHAGLIPTTDVQARVDMMLANRKAIIEKVKPLLIVDVDIYRLPGMKKDSLGKPGAEKLAALFNLKASFVVDKETMDAIGQQANGKQYIAYICNLTYKDQVAGQGRGATFIEWMRNSYKTVFKEEFDRLGLKEGEYQGPLNGTSKSSGKPYTYWRVPEPPVFDSLALNKAIKMAQKSAFVDAVIRTTGMSDLFTQDIEDGVVDTEPQNVPHESVMDVSSVNSSEPVSAERVCPKCGNTHTGKYPKCLACWQEEKRSNN